MRFVRTLIAAIFAVALPAVAIAQSVVLQGGAWTPGRASMYASGGGSQPVVLDSGPAGGGGVGVGLAEQLIVARGTGTAPYVGQGTGPFGSISCSYDAPTTNANGYHFLCFSPNATGGYGLISFGSGGVASPIDLKLNINGVLSSLGNVTLSSRGIKAPVLIATTANITLSGEQTIDGVLTNASRVLVKNQSTSSQNGIYLSAAGAWSRTPDSDTTGQIVSGTLVFVTSGTLNGQTTFAVTTADPITVGSSSINFGFYRFNGVTYPSSYTSGGIPYASASNTIASSGALTANGIVLGGGAGNPPTSTGAMTNGQILVGQTGSAPLPASVSGDATLAASGALTLATVNVSPGTSGSSTAIPTITVNGKGLVTAVTTNAVVAPAGTLTGTTLAANVVGSSLTGVGTLTSGAIGSGFTAIPNVALANSSTTVNGVPCTLGSTCTIVASATSITVNSTTVVGATAGKLFYSDGTKLQATATTVSAAGSLTIPATQKINFTLTTTGAVATYNVNCAIDWSGICGINAAGANTYYIGQAGPSNLSIYTGHDNFFVGDAAGNNCTSCNQDILIGPETGLAITTGLNWTCIGFEACHSATTQEKLTAYGSTACFYCTSPNIIAIGNGVSFGAGGGDSDVAIGAAAPLMTGPRNILIDGTGQAGQTIAAGADNICIGKNSCYGIAAGNGNVHIGSFFASLGDLTDAIILSDGDAHLRLDYGYSHSGAWTAQGNLFLAGISITPGSKQVLCIDTSTRQVSYGNAGSC